MKKLVSVIIPAYNHELYVTETIRSILDQDYNNIELVIIDDGSQDKTFEQILSLKEKCINRFTSFIYDRQENRGTCYTLNRLISLCHGDYISLIASDDIFLPDAISTLVENAENNPEYGLFVGRNLIMDEYSNVCYWNKKKENVYRKEQAKWLSFSDYLESTCLFNFESKKFGSYSSLFYSNYIPNGYLIRKVYIDKIMPFKNEAPLEDYWLMLQLSKITKMKYIRKDTFIYRWHSSNTVKNKNKMLLISTQTKKNEFLEIAKSFDNSEKYEESFLMFRDIYIDLFFGSKNYVKLLKYVVLLFIRKIRQFLLYYF